MPFCVTTLVGMKKEHGVGIRNLSHVEMAIRFFLLMLVMSMDKILIVFAVWQAERYLSPLFLAGVALGLATLVAEHAMSIRILKIVLEERWKGYGPLSEPSLGFAKLLNVLSAIAISMLAFWHGHAVATWATVVLAVAFAAYATWRFHDEDAYSAHVFQR